MTTTTLPRGAVAHAGTAAEDAAYARVTWRLLPLLFLCYVAAYLDRVNVGFAKLQMLNELKFSESIYGLGAGIFFIGYFIFEVPSNLMLHRFGARKWIARIMISWGVISGCMMFVQTPTSFYILRFFLGVAEAGFFPGIILYLTYWYPAARRAKVTSLFMTGIPMAGVIGGPLSGWILNAFDGAHGMAGWKWLFLLEAVPSIVLGVVVLVALKDRIADANWLSAEDKKMLQKNIAADGAHIEDHSASGAFRNPKVWVLSAAYFGFIMGLYGVGFWLPSLVKASGVANTTTIGFLVAIPYAAAVACMIWTSRHSDRTGERRWHIAIPAIAGAVGLVASTLVPQTPFWAIVTLTLATMGILTGLAQFWCLPPAFLGGAAAAAGIALINSVGNLAGFVSPFIVGWIKDVTGSTNNGLFVIAASLIVGGAIVLSMSKRVVNR
ncbi:MFS transporter [Variovorax sp. RHLX14]|uniref:MFS transporter n=1 Tax=Variovorax sp. RHLX14 TaxID=1259731 RepID=UPI003F459478